MGMTSRRQKYRRQVNLLFSSLLHYKPELGTKNAQRNEGTNRAARARKPKGFRALVYLSVFTNINFDNLCENFYLANYNYLR